MWSATVKATAAVAKAARPGIAFDDDEFCAFVHERKGALPAHGADLLAVYLWSVGAPGSTEWLEAEYLHELPAIVGAVEARADFVRDVLQELRTRLFAERRLLQYAGRGPLGGWLRRAAVNTASKLLRPVRREQPLDPESDDLAPAPELAFLKARYRDDFRKAFVEALQSLSARERTVLRLNALSNVSIDELGQMYQVHRATAARWVQKAREAIVERTQQTLVERLQLSPEELQELLAVMQSQLDVSIRRHLSEG